MPVAGGGFEQAYNAEAAVGAATMLVVATRVTKEPNDKEQVVPMLEVLEAQSAVLGTVERMIADTGFCSEKNILACEEAHLEPLIAVARDVHHPGWRERHSEPALLRDNATPMQSMAHRLESSAGRALYALRIQTVEPPFGIIKSVMDFRHLSVRSMNNVSSASRLH